jgi:DNA-binding LacI/PurR family transcriptional regulator
MNLPKRTLVTQELKQSLSAMIAKDLKPGELLPSQSDLCTRYEVAAGTVVNAIEALEQEGLVVRQHGRGTFVSNRNAPKIAAVFGPLHKTSPRVEALIQAASEQRLQYQIYIRDKEGTFLNEIVKNKVRGVLSFGITDEDSLRFLLKKKIKIVANDWAAALPGIDVVDADNFSAGRLAAEALLAAGHTRIGYVGFQTWSNVYKKFIAEPDIEIRLAGITTALISHQVEPNPSHFVRLRNPASSYVRQNAFSALDAYQQLFEKANPPTALIFSDEKHAEQGFTQIFAEKNILIPRDISAITISLLEYSRQLTTVGVSFEKIMEIGVELLLARLKGRSTNTSCRTLIECTLLDRQSVKKLK